MNYDLLNGVIVSKGMTQSELAEKLGLSKASFSYKMNGLRQWKAMELKKIKKILCLDDATFMSIFFADNVE